MTKDFCNSLCNSHVAVYNNSVNTEIKSVQPGDLVRIRDEKEVMLVVRTWPGVSAYAKVLRTSKLQVIPRHILEVINETR